MVETLLFYGLIGIYGFIGLYINYTLIRDDIRSEKERKAKLKVGQTHDNR